jgi:hypothetical protein
VGLEENARFCHKCGTPVVVAYASCASLEPATFESVAAEPPRRDLTVWVVFGLVVILVLAVAIVVFLVIPFGFWSFSTSHQDNTSNMRALNLGFEAVVGEMKAILQKSVGNNLALCCLEHFKAV